MTLNQPTKFAFTLAEVLIVLGIIGVVAELTIPTLMNNVQDSVFKTSYKQAFSTASQALITAGQQDSLVSTTSGDVAGFCANFIAFMGQFKVIKQCTNNDGDKCWNPAEEYFWDDTYPHSGIYSFVDASGAAWSMFHSGTNEILVDTNGSKKPNRWGKDRFAFSIIDPAYYDTSTVYDINDPKVMTGLPSRVIPMPDNYWVPCNSYNKCSTQNDYLGTSWLYK